MSSPRLRKASDSLDILGHGKESELGIKIECDSQPESKRQRLASTSSLSPSSYGALSPGYESSDLQSDFDRSSEESPKTNSGVNHALLHQAISQADLPLLESLLLQVTSASLSFINGYNQDGQTLLTHSCLLGNFSMVKLLVSYGADIRQANRDGWTPSHIASFKGNFNIMMYLLNCASRSRRQPHYGHLQRLPSESPRDRQNESALFNANSPGHYNENSVSRLSSTTPSTPPTSPNPLDSNPDTPMSAPATPATPSQSTCPTYPRLSPRKRSHSSSWSSSVVSTSFEEDSLDNSTEISSPLSPQSPRQFLRISSTSSDCLPSWHRQSNACTRARPTVPSPVPTASASDTFTICPQSASQGEDYVESIVPLSPADSERGSV